MVNYPKELKPQFSATQKYIAVSTSYEQRKKAIHQAILIIKKGRAIYEASNK